MNPGNVCNVRSEAFQRLLPLKARLKGVADVCLRKEAAVKHTFTRMLAHVFNEHIAEWTTVVISEDMHLQWFGQWAR